MSEEDVTVPPAAEPNAPPPATPPDDGPGAVPEDDIGRPAHLHLTAPAPGRATPVRLELAAPASVRPPASTYLEQKQEQVERLLGRYCSLGDLLGLEQTPDIDCSSFRRILDLGTREGNWALAMARKYPGVWVLGIDGSAVAIQRAEAMARAEGLGNVSFQVRSPGDLALSGMTARHFNLVRLHCLAGQLTPQYLPPLIYAAVGVCNRSGLVVWSEIELPITNSPPCETFCAALVRAMQSRRRGYGPGSALGVTAQMGVWLKLAGCQITEDRAQIVDVSAGMAPRKDFMRYMYDLGQQMRDFVAGSGLMSEKEYDELVACALKDMQGESFCGVCYARTVVGVRHSSRDPAHNTVSSQGPGSPTP